MTINNKSAEAQQLEDRLNKQVAKTSITGSFKKNKRKKRNWEQVLRRLENEAKGRWHRDGNSNGHRQAKPGQRSKLERDITEEDFQKRRGTQKC